MQIYKFKCGVSDIKDNKTSHLELNNNYKTFITKIAYLHNKTCRNLQ